MRIISLNTRVRGGLPCIAGTRIPLHRIFYLIKEGKTPTVISREFYPQVSVKKMMKVVDSLKFFIDTL